MKKTFLGCLFGVLLLVSCAQTEPMKPIKSGELWLDDKGVHVNAHGGGMLVLIIGMAKTNVILPVQPW